MTAPIMKGTHEDGRPFLAIKLSCHLTDENIDGYDLEELLKTHRDQTQVLLLYQSDTENDDAKGINKNIWVQVRGGVPTPLFFWGTFTKEDGKVWDHESEYFDGLNQIIRGKEAQDRNGVTWRLAT